MDEGYVDEEPRKPYHEEREEKRICFISVYSRERAYGGPEEGGWYYNVYELVASVPMQATATLRFHELDDDAMYAGGYDSEALDKREDIMVLTGGEVKEWDDPTAATAEMERLGELYPKKYYLVTEEVNQGELERLTRRRYC